MKLDDNKAKEILYALHRGVSPKDLAQKYGVSYGSITAVRDGVTYAHVEGPRRPPKKHLTEEQVCQVIEMWNSGRYSVADIAKHFGRSQGCIFKICKRRAFRHIQGPIPKAKKTRVRKSPIRDQARKLLIAGLSPSEVMAHLKCSVTPVYEAVAELKANPPADQEGGQA